MSCSARTSGSSRGIGIPEFPDGRRHDADRGDHPLQHASAPATAAGRRAQRGYRRSSEGQALTMDLAADSWLRRTARGIRASIAGSGGAASPLHDLPAGKRLHQRRAMPRNGSDLTGLELEELVAFRPRAARAARVLIRVTADLSVPDGSTNRGSRHQFPRDDARAARALHRPANARDRRGLRSGNAQAFGRSSTPSCRSLFAPQRRVPHAPARPKRRNVLSAFFRRGRRQAAALRLQSAGHARHLIAAWQDDTPADAAHCSGAPRARVASYRRCWFATTKSGAVASCSRRWSTDIACNEFGGDEIGRLIAPWLVDAARRGRLQRAAAAAAAGRHEHRRALGVGQKHAAPAAEAARRRHRRRLERIRADQPRHLAQATARLRRARRRVQVRGRIHRRGAADRRPEARPLHGAQGRRAATCRTC